MALIAIFCTTPTNPKENPVNSSVRLFSITKDTLSFGTLTKFGLKVIYPEHLNTISISSSCGDTTITISPDTLASIDTIYFETQFTNDGPCTLFAAAFFKNQRFSTKTSQLPLYVLAGKPKLNFTTFPGSFFTHTGKVDTLLFVVGGNKGNIVEFKATSVPQLGEQELALVKTTSHDTVRVIFNPSVADTYAVWLHAEAKLSASIEDVIKDSVFARIRVYKAIVLSLAQVPQNIIPGSTDTLIFAVDNKSRPDPLSLNLLSETALDSAYARIIKASSDSLFIAVIAPIAPDSIDIAIRLSNGVVSDTMRYRIDCITEVTTLWSKSTVAVGTIEGKKVRHDLKPYFVKPSTGQVAFGSDIGSVTADTVWEWTPGWGSAATAVATITAQNGDIAKMLQVTATVSPGDSGKPNVRLVDESLNGKKVGSSQITIDCIVKDSSAGIAIVSMIHSGVTVEAVRKNDTVFSGVISGLKHNVPEDVTVSATDSSMKKNTGSISFSITFDSTVIDAEMPAIVHVSGPKSGDRVITAEGTIVYSIIDNSGVDSVWWTLNETPAGVPTKLTDSTYSLSYSLLTFGANKIKLFARDKSFNKNSGSVEITLDYNTEITPVTLLAPLNVETAIATQPTFTWNGGDDLDGSPVYFVVKYGTAVENLTGSTSDTTGKTLSISAGNALSPNTKYFWMVVAYSKVNKDSVKSEVRTFTTVGVAPVISRQPDSVTVSVGGTISLSVTATGNPACSYQWQKDGIDLQGKTSLTLSITPAKLEDAGVYRCVVSNSADTINSNGAAVKVLPTYSLTISRSPDAGGTVTKVKDTTVYEAGSTVTLTAAALAGYRFDSWIGDTTATGNVLILVMNKNRAVTANFKRQYTLTLTSSASIKGSVTPSGGVAVDSGKAYSISAVANSGYKFKKWSTTGVGVVFLDSMSASTSVTLTKGDAAVQGVFGCVTFKKKLNFSQYPDVLLKDAIQTEDGGYLVVADIGVTDGLLIKLNSNGDTSWTKIILPNQISSIQKVNTGYIVTGIATNGGNGNIQVTCFAQNGYERWSFVHGNNPEQNYWTSIAKPTSDNGYIVSGVHYPSIQLIKIDENRNITWEKTIQDDDVAYGISDCQPTADGYILVGSVAQGFVACALKTDAQGNRQWMVNFRSYFPEGISGNLYSVSLANDGDCIISGGGRKNAEDVGYLVKMSPTDTSQIRFFKFYSDAQQIRTVKPTVDGYFLVGSTKTLGNGEDDIYVAKTNATGDIIKQSAYGTSGIEYGLSLKLTGDGGCIVIGGDNSSIGNNSWIIKTDENGNVD